ncbi:hypothetical protein IMSAGC020_02415 [Lachnospiraceae bacterium]|nr:hypothetical protein IMSAGC020_02415 [Lachnospiraceae bacterium]
MKTYRIVFWGGILSGLAGMLYFKMGYKKKLFNLQERINVLSDHFQLLNHWLEIKAEGKNIVSYFEEFGCSHIAIYGMAELANRLTDELWDAGIVVDYGIDRDISCTIGRIREIYYPDDNLPETEMIVVTPYSDFEKIKKNLEKKVDCPIISLEEVVWSV